MPCQLTRTTSGTDVPPLEQSVMYLINHIVRSAANAAKPTDVERMWVSGSRGEIVVHVYSKWMPNSLPIFMTVRADRQPMTVAVSEPPNRHNRMTFYCQYHDQVTCQIAWARLQQLLHIIADTLQVDVRFIELLEKMYSTNAAIPREVYSWNRHENKVYLHS